MAAYQPILEQIEAGIREGRFVEPEDLAKAAHRLIREATTTLPYHPGPDGGAAFSVEDLGLTEREVLILSEYYGARLPETEICSRHNIPPAELKALGRWARAAARRLTEKRQMSA